MPARKRQKMKFPLPPVTDVEGRRCVCLSIPDEPAHIEAFWGNLWSLSQWFNWEKSDGRHGKEVADVWREIWETGHDKFNARECCGESEETEAICQDYPAHSGIIQYKPSDPFLTPNFIPEPYNQHPFLVGENQWIPGAEPGDVAFTFQSLFANILDLATWAITDLPAWAIGLITDYDNWFNADANNLFPRFKIRFSGSGTVDLHLLKVPLGGLAYITLDGDPTGLITSTQSIDLIDFESWLSGLSAIGLGALVGNLIQVDIIQIPVTGEGEHYLDVTFIPKISIVPPNVSIGWGGGLRKIELCGVKPIFPVPPTRESPAGTCIEWLNPVTRIWECIATIAEEKICPDCGELLAEFEECEEMACLKCAEGSVIYCDGKLQYKKADGTYADVPAAAIPSGTIPPVDPDNPIPAVGANACYKASGIWAYIQRATTALIDAANSSGFADDNYFSLRSSGFNFDNIKLFKFMFDWTDTTIGAGIHEDTTAYWVAEKEAIGNEFICALQDILGKDDRLSSAEYDALIHLADVFDTGLNEMNDLLFDAVKVIEKKAFEVEAYNAVQAQFGTCNCAGDTPAIDPLDPAEGCGIILFRGFGLMAIGTSLTAYNPTELMAGSPKWGQSLGTGIKSTFSSGNNQFGFSALFELIGDPDWKLASLTATFNRTASEAFLAQDIGTYSALDATTDFMANAHETDNSSPWTLTGGTGSDHKFIAVAAFEAIDGQDANAYVSAALTFYVYRASSPGTFYPVTFNLQFC